MRSQLLTKDYKFYVVEALNVEEKDTIAVEYLTGDHKGKIISLSNIEIEMIGIVTNKIQFTWSVSIITPASIKKLRDGITENLSIIGFKFNDLQSALEAQSFILYWDLKL